MSRIGLTLGQSRILWARISLTSDQSMPRVGLMPSPPEPTVGVPRLGQLPSAPIITQHARVTNPLMVQCWSSFYDAGPTLTHQWMNVSCLLGTQLPVQWRLFFLQYFILPHFAIYITAGDERRWNQIVWYFRIALSLYFEMPERYRINNSKFMFFKKITQNQNSEKYGWRSTPTVFRRQVRQVKWENLSERSSISGGPKARMLTNI